MVKYLFENSEMSYCLFSLQLSVYGESAWEYDDVRKECYRHTFLKEEPDLNLMNDDVRTEMRVLYLFVLVITDLIFVRIFSSAFYHYDSFLAHLTQRVM